MTTLVGAEDVVRALQAEIQMKVAELLQQQQSRCISSNNRGNSHWEHLCWYTIVGGQSLRAD